MRRKILTIILIIVLTTPILPIVQTASAAGGDYSTVRVKLSMGAAVSIPVVLDGNYSVSGNEGVTLQRQLYTVKLESTVINLYYGNTLLCGGSSLKLVQHSPTTGLNNFIWMYNPLYGEDNPANGYIRYLGDIEFITSVDSKTGNPYIAVINHVYIEDYLYGVVPYEMSNSWPIEALKTQAISARTYVKRYMKTDGNYDVVDTSANQVYRGYNPSNTNAIQAVDSTANTVLTCGGDLVQTYYSASNGGNTELPQHAWTATAPIMPYHIILQDSYDLLNPYSPQEVLVFPKMVNDTNKISYLHSSGGSMVPGTGSESANAQRYLEVSALPAVAAKGYIASVTSDIQIVGINSITPNTYEDDQHNIKDYNVNDACANYKNADINMTVLANRNATDEEQQQTGQPTVQEQVTVDFMINMHEFDSDGGIYQSFDNLSLRLFSVEQTDSSWNIYHRRYGHGIGMSQRGAQQRALSSDPNVNTYDKILAFYYPNTALTVQTYSKAALTPIAIPDSSNASVISPGDPLNVRSSPDSSTNANKIGALPDGARVNVTQPSAAPGWHKIEYGGQDAYISAAYVQIDIAEGGITPPQLTPAPNPNPTHVLLGDINIDGAVSISDYSLVRLAILGLKSLSDNEKAAADVNKDGNITISDYTLIRLDILGLQKIN